MLFLLLFLCITYGTVAINIPDSEWQALHDFYVFNGGEYWSCCSGGINSTAWNFTNAANPCTDHWQGITCIFPSPFDSYYVSEIQLNNHNLSGGVPISLTNLSHLENLSLNHNFFGGSIPSAIGALSQLTQLALSLNNYTGTIPQYLGQFKSLQALKLDENQLEGTIPCLLTNLTSVVNLQLAANLFTGSIPTCLLSLTQLIDILLSNNYLTGTIPSSVGAFITMADFRIDGNYITGTIPETIGEMSDLLFLHLNSNCLTGSIPTEVSKLTQMTDIYLSHNYFSGTFPCLFSQMTNCLLLYANDNCFTGSIPVALGQLQHMEYLQLSENYFSGTVPTALSNCSSLTDVQITFNQLTGSLNGVFNVTNQVIMSTIQFNDNSLTGTIPDEIFQFPILETIVLSKNCFHGTLPSRLCYSNKLTTLVLDGLSSAPACRNDLMPMISSSYILRHSVGGTLPKCLFQLPQLTTLHLSGNGFHGTLPDHAVLNNGFNDLSLSHNLFEGAIEDYIQNRRWYNLDLSFNRFSGTLRSDFATVDLDIQPRYKNETFLSLENNRLSGSIPEKLRDMLEISILGSNLFSCDLNQNEIPNNDDGKRTYHCGSTDFNWSYYVWLSLACVGGFVGLVCFSKSLSKYLEIDVIIGKLRKWLEVTDPNIKQYGASFSALGFAFDVFTKVTLSVTVYIVFLLMPLYAVLTRYYGVFTYEYAYSTSAAFLSGYGSFFSVFVSWILLFCLLLSVCSRYLAERADVLPTTKPHVDPLNQLPPSSIQKTILLTCFVAINVSVVVSVNGLYVYTIINGNDVEYTAAVGILSIFKLFWNKVAVFYLMRLCCYWFAPSLLLLGNLEEMFLVCQVRVALLNTLVIPCLVLCFISPSCFYNVLFPPPSIHTSYVTNMCILIVDNECVLSLPLRYYTSNYDPPFSYGYQCSSSLVTSYAPVFVYLCIISTFVVPLAKLLLLYWHGRASSSKDTRWFRLLNMLLPRMLKPLPSDCSDISSVSFFKPSRRFIDLTNNLALLLTFGVMFPPLALALAVTITSNIQYSKLELGRFILNATDYGKLKYVDIVKKECAAVKPVSFLLSTIWTLVTISWLFYTIFLFDNLGDVVGFNKAYWVLIVGPCIPLLFFVVHRAVVRFKKSPAEGDIVKDNLTGIEMQKVDEVNRDVVSGALDTDIVSSTHNIILDPK